MPAKAPADLIDLIYRDPHRIPSFYAQLFSGNLISQEITTSARTAEDSTTGYTGGIKGLISGEAVEKSTDENTTGTKEVLQPGDITTVDVVSTLLTQGWVDGGIFTAKNSTIVRSVGTLHFFNPAFLQGSIGAISAILAQSSPDAAAATATVGTLFSLLSFPPVFYLQDDGGRICYGTFAADGLAEPLEAFSMKHGQGGLDQVTLVGIKETTGRALYQGPAITEAMAQSSQMLSQIFAPVGGIKVSPICIFRKLSKPS